MVRYESSEPSLTRAFPAVMQLIRQRSAGGDGFCSGGGDRSLAASLNSCLSVLRVASASGHVFPCCLQSSAKAPVSSLGFCGVDATGTSFGIAGIVIAGIGIVGFCLVRGYVSGMASFSSVRGGKVCAGGVIGAGSFGEVWVAGLFVLCVSMKAGSSIRLGSGFFAVTTHWLGRMTLYIP